MYSSKIRNIELPENLFSNLGEMKSKKINAQENLKHYEEPSNIEDKSNEISTKMTNFSKHKEYRNRINQMYEGMKEITKELEVLKNNYDSELKSLKEGS